MIQPLTREEVGTAWLAKLKAMRDKYPFINIAWLPPLILFVMSGLASNFSRGVITANLILSASYILYSGLACWGVRSWRSARGKARQSKQLTATLLAIGDLTLFMLMLSIMFIWTSAIEIVKFSRSQIRMKWQRRANFGKG